MVIGQSQFAAWLVDAERNLLFFHPIDGSPLFEDVDTGFDVPPDQWIHTRTRLDWDTRTATLYIEDEEIWSEPFGGFVGGDAGALMYARLIVEEPGEDRIFLDNFRVDWAEAGGCAADFNGDGELNVLDFVAFQLAWSDQDPLADCDSSGTFDVLDFVCFQSAFLEGCE